MNKSARISYVILAVLLVLIGGLHMATLLLTVLFGYFALNFLSFGRSKLLGIAFYLIVVASIGYGFIFFSRQAYIALPEIAEKTIPAVVGSSSEAGRSATPRPRTTESIRSRTLEPSASSVAANR